MQKFFPSRKESEKATEREAYENAVNVLDTAVSLAMYLLSEFPGIDFAYIKKRCDFINEAKKKCERRLNKLPLSRC